MRFPRGKCDAIVLFNGEPYQGTDANFFFHCKLDADHTALVWGKKGKTVVTSALNERKCKRQSKFPVRVLSPRQRFSDLIKKILPKKAKRIGLDMGSIPASRMLSLRKSLGKKLVDVSEDLLCLRAVKNAHEISMIRKACKKSLGILDSLEFSNRMAELDVLRQLSVKCAEEGVQLAYPPIVATGKNSSLPHHTPSGKKLERIVLIDFGVKIGNYCSDLTRCYFLSGAKKEKGRYAQAKEVFHEIVGGMPSCATAGALVELADAAAEKKGWPKMPHAIGHGVGLEVHEAPRLYGSSKEKLSPGMVMAIEPGWYGGNFGVRYENEIVFGKKCKVL